MPLWLPCYHYDWPTLLYFICGSNMPFKPFNWRARGYVNPVVHKLLILLNCKCTVFLLTNQNLSIGTKYLDLVTLNYCTSLTLPLQLRFSLKTLLHVLKLPYHQNLPILPLRCGWVARILSFSLDELGVVSPTSHVPLNEQSMLMSFLMWLPKPSLQRNCVVSCQNPKSGCISKRIDIWCYLFLSWILIHLSSDVFCLSCHQLLEVSLNFQIKGLEVRSFSVWDNNYFLYFMIWLWIFWFFCSLFLYCFLFFFICLDYDYGASSLGLGFSF